MTNPKMSEKNKDVMKMKAKKIIIYVQQRPFRPRLVREK